MTTNTTQTTGYMHDVVEFDRYAYNTLVTDSRPYEIIARTAKTMTVRGMKRTGKFENVHIGGNPYPVNYEQAESDPEAETYVLRLRKDGTYRLYRGGNPLRPTKDPVFVTDYRY